MPSGEEPSNIATEGSMPSPLQATSVIQQQDIQRYVPISVDYQGPLPPLPAGYSYFKVPAKSIKNIQAPVSLPVFPSQSRAPSMIQSMPQAAAQGLAPIPARPPAAAPVFGSRFVAGDGDEEEQPIGQFAYLGEARDEEEQNVDQENPEEAELLLARYVDEIRTTLTTLIAAAGSGDIEEEHLKRFMLVRDFLSNDVEKYEGANSYQTELIKIILSEESYSVLATTLLTGMNEGIFSQKAIVLLGEVLDAPPNYSVLNLDQLPQIKSKKDLMFILENENNIYLPPDPDHGFLKSIMADDKRTLMQDDVRHVTVPKVVAFDLSNWYERYRNSIYRFEEEDQVVRDYLPDYKKGVLCCCEGFCWLI